MLIRRGDVRPVERPTETIEVGPLGGAVLVRALTLTERLSLGAERIPRESFPSVLLARCVVDADFAPLFDVAQWESFGAAHFDDAMAIFEVASRLSGFGVGEKNA